MIKRTLTCKTLLDWAFGQLSLAQHHFALNPNANEWHKLQRAMFVYQQAYMAIHSKAIDENALLKKLAPMNSSIWGDAISMTTVGMTVVDALDSFHATA